MRVASSAGSGREPHDADASVAVMNARDALRTANLGKLGEPDGKVAEGGAGRNGYQAECGDGDARACVQAIQQEHESGDRHGRDCD